MLMKCREAGPGGGTQSGEDPGDLPGGVAGLRHESPRATHDRVRQAPVGPHRAAHSGQPQLGDVLLSQAQKQKIAAFPRRNLGRPFVKTLQPTNYHPTPNQTQPQTGKKKTLKKKKQKPIDIARSE